MQCQKLGSSANRLVPWLLAFVWACAEPAAEQLESGLSLRYLTACRPGTIDQITVEALGDYPASEDSFVSLRAADGPTSFDDLPLAAQAYRVVVSTATGRAVAIADAADDGTVFDALVTPLGTLCEVTERPLSAPSGAAMGLVGASDLVLAGGNHGAGARSDLTHYQVARQRARSVGSPLFVARTEASAVAVGNELWLVGGASQALPGSTALQSFERYDASAREVGALGRLEKGRIRPGVLALNDGSVLVAGGTARLGGPGLDSIERISAGGARAALLRTKLPRRLASPLLSQRDDGTVLIAADDGDALVLALFDPRSAAIELLDPPPGPSAARLVLPLPGDRVVAVELDRGVTSGVLFVWSERFGWLRRAGSLTPFAGLGVAELAVLANGRLLLTGELNGRFEARLIDPGSLTVSRRALEHRVERIFLRADGAALLFGAGRLSLLRESEGSTFDNPGGTLLADEAGLVALDSARHWHPKGLGWVAGRRDARLDIAGLSYLDVAIEVEVEGEAELLLRQLGGATRTVRVGGRRVGPLLCELSVAEGGRVRVVRRGESLRVEVGEQQQDCSLSGLTGRLALGVRALEADTYVRWLSAERL